MHGKSYKSPYGDIEELFSQASVEPNMVFCVYMRNILRHLPDTQRRLISMIFNGKPVLFPSRVLSQSVGLTLSRPVIIIAASSLNVIIRSEMTSERLCLIRSENKCSAFVLFGFNFILKKQTI